MPSQLRSEWQRGRLASAVCFLGTCAIGLGTASEVASGGPAEVLCFGEAPTIVGTPGDDEIVVESSERKAVVVTGAGDDRIMVEANQVRVCEGGGQGYVHIDDYVGPSRLDMGTGRDRVTYSGPAGAFSPGAAIVRGGQGADLVRTGGFRDRLFGNEGDDDLGSWSAADEISGGIGDDRIYGGPDSDRMRGGRGDDLLDGDPPESDEFPGGNDDRADGGGGNDRCEAETVQRCEVTGEF